MKRITSDGCYCDIVECDSIEPCGGTCLQKQLWDRLKEYEDTNISADDLGANPDIDFARVVQLMMADAEGKALVLPCKVGDEVYGFPMNGKRPMQKSVVSEIRITDDMQIVINVKRVCNFGFWGKNVFKTEEECAEAIKNFR